MFDAYGSMFKAFVQGWRSGNILVRALIIATLVGIFSIVGIGVAQEIGSLEDNVAKVLIGGIGVVAGLFGASVLAFDHYISSQQLQAREHDVERQVRANPESPQLAWDLARIKLESYLDRNLSQVRSIYWLTLVVMIAGFVLISYGIYQATLDPEKLPMSIVASASGVLVSFIGGSFLLIYRSILSQSKGYVSVLERINAVGMAVQVIASIPESNSDLKHETTADLAKQLLHLYAAPSAKHSTNRSANE